MAKDFPKTVGEVMTKKVITIGPNETLQQIEQGMERFRFRHLPVVEDGKLIGLVSHRDLLHALSSFLSEAEEQRNAVIRQQPAKLIMQHDVITIRAHEALLDAAKLMWEAKLGCLPVVDEEDQVVGIITEADFMRAAIHLLGGAIPPPPPSKFKPE
jgi:CBS domain-containing membrane protein